MNTAAPQVALVVKTRLAMQETQETHVRPAGSLVWEDPLEESMATLSSSLAWRIPWTEEHGGWWATVHGISESDTIEAT